MKRLFFNKLLFFLVFFPALLSAQQYRQTVRGVVMEQNTREYLHGAAVIVTSEGKPYGTTTNELGEFIISDVSVGRCHIEVSMLGFVTYISNNILVYSGKETVLEIVMEENIQIIHEITVAPKVDKDLPTNKMATASVRMFSTEEANRYAGSWGDPARMAANFAGVSASNDSRNDIIIRGNSPLGLLWRLDGFDIPNPNHFSVTGSSGGAISMINNNQLANSDFYTGAFPAEFGNVISGVFDLKLRNGNYNKREFLVSIGMNGAELGAEGYFSKKSNASYLINARYSFLDVLYEMGMDFGTDGGIPKYRDLCAKINIPVKKGNISLITLLGANKIKIEDDMNDEKKWKQGDVGEFYEMKANLIFWGTNYTRRLSENTRLENRLSYQSYETKENNETVAFKNLKRWKNFSSVIGEGRIDFSSTLFHRIDSRNFLETGAGCIFLMTNLYETNYDRVENPIPLRNMDKNSSLLKLFMQWQHRLNEKITFTPGFYSHYYALTNNLSIEPRIGMQWKTSSNTSVNFETGLYSQLQPRIIYFYQDGNGQTPNQSLKFTDSWQTVAGFNRKFAGSFRLKSEIYYQYLYHVPVIFDLPQESILNFDEEGHWFNTSFVNKGTGQNYGIELTLERFLDNNFYFLITSSLYQSKYKGYDQIERNTKYNGNYSLNILGGYEWKIGKNNLLAANVKSGYFGGKRNIPIKIVTDSSGVRAENDYSQAYTNRYPDYFRLDLNINMKMNFKQWALEFFVELANVTNHKNIWTQYYNSMKQEVSYVYHYGFTPIAGVKMFF